MLGGLTSQHLWFERSVESTACTDMTEPISPASQRIIEVACYALGRMATSSSDRWEWAKSVCHEHSLMEG